MLSSEVTSAASSPRRIAIASTASRYRIPSPVAGAVDCSAATAPVAIPIAAMISAVTVAPERRIAAGDLEWLGLRRDTITKATTVRGRVVNGDVELAVRECGDHDGIPLVFIHGYPDTKEVWNGVLELLPARLHAIAYDVRGAGDSSRPRGNAAYDFERLGDDLLAVIDALAPGRKVHLVGHDWGGIQGWEFATHPRFEGRLASFTSIAGPSLDQVAIGVDRLLRHGRSLRWLSRLRRSWYLLPLLTPGMPTLMWRFVWSADRWRWMLRNVERVPVGDDDPRPTLARDGIDGAKLYRRNMPRRAIRPRTDAIARVPVQLVVPSGDRFISPEYYELADRHAPRLRRRIVGSGHWAPRAQPERIAGWIESFVDEVEADGGSIASRRPWRRGGGVGELRDRLALITGAASGIGAASARALAAHGARVLLVDRDEQGVARVADSIEGAHWLSCDVADEDAMEHLARVVLGEHGAPQVVVNNAGIGIAGAFLDTGFDDWRQIVSVNLMGVVHGCRLFGRAMVEQG